MPTINIGRVRPNWMGEWSEFTTYAILDAVFYAGSSYIMKELAIAGTLPTVAAKWMKLAQKGDAGPQGIQGIQGISYDPTFEFYANNYLASDPTYAYTGERLDSVTFANGVVKSLNYTGENLTSVVLTGSILPTGMNKTKTFSYDGDKLLSAVYSA
jgi:hypothetical protein